MLKNFSKKFKTYRKTIGLSLQDLSIKTNLSVSYLSLLENGERKNPSLDTLDKIANAFDIDILKLLDL